MTTTEIISAGGAIEEEEDDVGEAGDGAPTATFMKPADTTGLSGLLNPRRPPTGGRDGFGSRLPTPYPPPQSPIPGPSTSPFASRLGPAPIGSPYAGRATGAAMPAIQVPPPSGKATTETGPGFFAKQVPMGSVMLLCFGFFVAGFGIRGPRRQERARAAVVVAKPAAAPTAPAVVVEPVQNGQPAVNPEPKPADTTAIAKPATPPGTEPPAGTRAAGRQSGSRTVASGEEADCDGEAAQAAGRHGRRRRRRRQAETRHREGAQAPRDAGDGDGAPSRRNPSPP